MKNEIWKDIDGYEGLYQVSNLGRVKSLNYRRTGKERILKALKDRYGYLHVKLCKDGKAKEYTIHRLVAEAFLYNPNGFSDVNHKDEDKENNAVGNLEWCSHKYNSNYGTGAKRSAEKRRNDPKRRKPVISVSKESGLIMEFESTKEAERVTGVYCGNIVNCCKGRYKSAGGFYWFYANDITE